MANVNAPFGLMPIGNIGSGAPSTGEMAPITIAYNDTTKIYRGDPVKKLSTGFCAQWSAGTAVSQLAGIFWGCEYLSSSQGKKVYNNFWPGSDVASTAQNTILGWVIPCNLAVPGTFLVQSDSTGVAFADVGQNIDVALGTGSTLIGKSGCYLDVSTLNTTATLPFRIKGLYGGVPGAGGSMGIQPGDTGPYSGSATGAYNWVLVQANVSGAGSTGI